MTAPVQRGIEHLSTQFVPLPPGVWTNIPLQVTLPFAGNYLLDANVRGRLHTADSPIDTFIRARLWNDTSGAAVPNSERLVYQTYGDGSSDKGGNGTAPISALISVTVPTTIRLQAMRTDTLGAPSHADIFSDGEGFTSLRYALTL
jgi:hypothetical protein